MKFTMEMPVNITDGDLSDIMSTAFDGGINYWCGAVKKLGNLSYKIYDAESDDTWTFNKDDLLRGIKQYAENYHGWRIFDVNEDGLYIEHAYIDASVADAIVQCACMGEIVFG